MQETIQFQMVENWKDLFTSFFQAHQARQVFVLVDSKTKKHCLPKIQEALPNGFQLITIPHGEVHKTLETCSLVWDKLSGKNADRKAILLNLGGGVVGDLGGFCAATYKRGIDFIQIPTTLLAMVDASLGGKTGIDFQGFKNQVGVFRQPLDVWVDPSFLQTLSETELISGFAEVVKHALIADVQSWQLLRKKELHQQAWKDLIPASLRIKQAVVQQDPFESGIRKTLNAGHTIGHAIETLLLQKGTPFPHGQCVAAGLIMESFIACKNGLLPENELAQIEEFIYAQFEILPIQKSWKTAIWKTILQDKKNESQQVRMALIGPIGNCSIDVVVSQDEVNEAVGYYLG